MGTTNNEHKEEKKSTIANMSECLMLQDGATHNMKLNLHHLEEAFLTLDSIGNQISVRWVWKYTDHICRWSFSPRWILSQQQLSLTFTGSSNTHPCLIRAAEIYISPR